MMKFDGKVSLITGGASGIGLATAKRLTQEGSVVYIADIQEQLGNEVASEISARFIHLDVTCEDQWSKAVSTIKNQNGRLDFLVNNAGVAAGGTVETETIDSFNRTIAINLTSVFLGCQACIPLMEQSGGGAIVNTSSIFGIVADQLTLAYSASKGGVRAMTKSIALDCASRGTNVRVNSVHPGFIATPLVTNALNAIPEDTAEEYSARTVGLTPLGMGEPSDIADVIAFLLSDDARYMTGSEVVEDGGFTAR